MKSKVLKRQIIDKEMKKSTYGHDGSYALLFYRKTIGIVVI